MGESRLTWWIFRCLTLFLSLGFIIFLYYQFQIYEELETMTVKNNLQRHVVVARAFIEPRIGDDLRERCNEYCQELALLTRVRVTVVTGAGDVLGDSLYGSNFRLDKLIDPFTFTEMYDTSSGKRIMSYAAELSRKQADEPLLIRVSTPLIENWQRVNIFIKKSALLIIVYACIVILTTRIIGSRIAEDVDNLRDSVERLDLREKPESLPHSELHEIESLRESLTQKFDNLHQQFFDLKQKAAQWEVFFSTMHQGIIALDQNLNLVAINSSAETKFGLLERKKSLGRPLLEVIRHNDLNQFVSQFSDQDEFRETDLQIQSPNDESHTYRVSGMRFRDVDDALSGTLLIFSDITRIKNLEQMRQDFVANVSHELRTPITTIKGYLETLPDCLETDHAGAQKMIGIIASNTDRLNSIIEDLLYLSRLEQGDRQIDDEFLPVNIKDIVAHAVSALETKFIEKNINCQVNIPEYTLTLNGHLIEQAFGNLIANAIKYSPIDSTVVISGELNESNFVVHVTDHGIGIPARQQSRIFERFYRVDKSRDRRSGGTGLGLAIAKHIVHIHNGNIKVQSEPGRGSTFTVSLPLA